MPDQEPVISHEQSAIDESPAQNTAVDARQPAAYERPAYEDVDGQDEWLEEPEQLPRRPRRRLLGAGGNRIFLALIGVLLIACGFIGGVLVEKSENSSSPSTAGAAGLASRFAALRGGTSSTGARSGATGAAAGGLGGASSSGAGFTRPTAGTVAYLAGDTLYVTNSEGNTIKVTTSPGTSVTKTVKASVDGIHPGETVTITGETAKNGTVDAESISVGGGGGLAALLGGLGGGTRAGRGAGTGSGGAEPSLFGGG
jgi:hypothetical protein